MAKIYHRNCDKCGIYYEGLGKRFCSVECSGSEKKYAKCLTCGQKFNQRFDRKKYCSRKCYLIAKAKTKKPKKEKKIKILKKFLIKCKTCNKEFYIFPCNKSKKFCSYKCAGEFRRKHINPRSLPPKVLEMSKRYWVIRARAEKYNFPICSKDDFLMWYENQPKICEYCSIPQEIWERLFRGEQHHFSLSIDRKNSQEGYVVNNLTLACGRCNTIKSRWLTYEEMKEIGEKYLKPKWQELIKEVSNVKMDLER